MDSQLIALYSRAHQFNWHVMKHVTTTRSGDVAHNTCVETKYTLVDDKKRTRGGFTKHTYF